MTAAAGLGLGAAAEWRPKQVLLSRDSRFVRVSQASAMHPASGWTLFSDATSLSLHSNPRRRVLLPVFCQQRETEAQRIKRQACLRSLGKWCGRGCGEQVCALTLNGDQSGQETWKQRWGLMLKSGGSARRGIRGGPRKLGWPAGWLSDGHVGRRGERDRNTARGNKPSPRATLQSGNSPSRSLCPGAS